MAQYPGAWFWSSMLIATMSVLVTSGWFWAHIGYEKHCQRILDAVIKEDWELSHCFTTGSMSESLGGEFGYCAERAQA